MRSPPLAKPLLGIFLVGLNLVLFLEKWQIATNTVSTAHKAAMNESNATARPTGLRLVMIGDSLTRYQYHQSLAYFLRYGTWFEPNQTDQHYLTIEKTFSSWAHFYTETTWLFHPFKKCDCFHKNYYNRQRIDNHLIENRYFFDQEHNNSLVYLSAFGNTFSTIHGRIIPSDAFHDIASFQFNHTKMPVVWKYKDWGTAIDEYICPNSMLPMSS